MQNFVIKNLVTENIEAELEKIGFDKTYIHKASDKYRYKTLKIFDLTLPQANILKQTALSLGADCGVHRDVLVNKVEETNVILGGSFSQLHKICEKLKSQPFNLKKLAAQIEEELQQQTRITNLVGILNVTPDSFSDGGLYIEPKKALDKVNELIADGADIIDIGAESTKPLSVAVSDEEQIERLRPILKLLPEFTYSIDTRSSRVAEFALNNGIKIINDVSGFDYDSKIIDIAAKYNAQVVIQHSTAKAEDVKSYNDVVEEIYLNLCKKINYAKEKGITNIIIDPGIGFGKSQKDNFEILNRIEEFKSLKAPIMVGISRKSMLGLAESNNNDLKDTLSLALAYPLMQKNIDYLRVHNVKLHKQLLNLAI